MPISVCLRPALASSLLLAAAAAEAQNVCLAPTPITPEPVSLEAIAPATSEFLEIEFGNASGNIGDGRSELTGGIRFRYGGGTVRAERASYADDDPLIEVLGNVSLEDQDVRVFAETMSFDRTTSRASFIGAGLEIPAEAARATAARIDVETDGLISLSEIMFTTCPEDAVAWQLLGRELEINREAGFGRARGVRLKMGPVPILYAPSFSFPIDDTRKSGFLAPQIAERDRTGFDLTIPYYVNLAPNYDLLLEPRFMEDRGTQLRSTFRYLLQGSEGSLELQNLTDDRIIDRARHFVHLEHDSVFGERWALETYLDDVSDSAYFEDLGDNLGVISQTHLDRHVDLSFNSNRWFFVSRFQEYQTIDDQIADVDRPYRRRPQMLFQGRWGDGLVGFESFAEAVDFDRSIGVIGWRFDATQELSLRFARAGMYLTPAIGFRQTNYRVERTGPGEDPNPSRGLPVASLDAGLRFERMTGARQTWIQTIEPRLLYVNIPYEDQSNLPIFDTILPDFNLVQLFSKYRFVGGDRIADTDQLSAGLTMRLIESASGRERVTATVGQTRYREARRTILPGETALDSRHSNYVAELGVTLSDNWSLDVGYQWNGETEQTVRSETRFEFQPQADRIFGIGYRMRRNLLEQGDLSMVWPVGERWRLIGQYSYSLLEQKPLERFAGLEYEACCWRIRLTSRSYIIRSTGETDESISIQLELKGLSRQSATPEELLGRGILSYRRFDSDSL